MKLLSDAPPVDAEIFALWLADLALAQRLGWDAPVPLLATTIAHASLRRGAKRQASASGRCGLGRRRRPAPMRWPPKRLMLSPASWRALAKSFSPSKPKLRAKGAGRVIELLLSTTRFRRRAPRKSRGSPIAPPVACSIGSIELGAVRELSGRPNFRLYGL